MAIHKKCGGKGNTLQKKLDAYYAGEKPAPVMVIAHDCGFAASCDCLARKGRYASVWSDAAWVAARAFHAARKIETPLPVVVQPALVPGSWGYELFGPAKKRGEDEALPVAPVAEPVAVPVVGEATSEGVVIPSLPMPSQPVVIEQPKKRARRPITPQICRCGAPILDGSALCPKCRAPLVISDAEAAALRATLESVAADFESRERMAQKWNPPKDDYERSSAWDERTVICRNPLLAVSP